VVAPSAGPIAERTITLLDVHPVNAVGSAVRILGRSTWGNGGKSKTRVIPASC
jgi:hypothetical protein